MAVMGKSIAKGFFLKKVFGFKQQLILDRSVDLIGSRRSSVHPQDFLSSVPQTKRIIIPQNYGRALLSRRLFTDEHVFVRCMTTINPQLPTENHEIKKTSLVDDRMSQDSIVGMSKSTPDEEEEKRRKDAFAKKAMKWSLVAMGMSFIGAAGFAVLEWGQPAKDENGVIIRDEFSDKPMWQQFILRSWKELVFYEKMIKEPCREKLLPDPLKEPYHQPPYTLVLEMTGVLVHPDWTYATGWRFKKRPGVEYFLEQLAGPFFEIVIYTSEQAFTAFPILLSLDPNNYIMYRLFRDSTRYVKGKHVKDLSYLNRDLSKVIVVDYDPDVIPGHERNAIFLPKWNGNDSDRTLFDLATFLKTIAASDVEDVREVLDNYKDEDDILAAFRHRQELLREEQTKVAAVKSHLQEEQEKRNILVSVAPSIFGRR